MAARGVPVLGHPGLVVKGQAVVATDMSRYREIQRERTRTNLESLVSDLQRAVSDLARRVTELEAK